MLVAVVVVRLTAQLRRLVVQVVVAQVATLHLATVLLALQTQVVAEVEVEMVLQELVVMAALA